MFYVSVLEEHRDLYYQRLLSRARSRKTAEQLGGLFPDGPRGPGRRQLAQGPEEIMALHGRHEGGCTTYHPVPY